MKHIKKAVIAILSSAIVFMLMSTTAYADDITFGITDTRTGCTCVGSTGGFLFIAYSMIGILVVMLIVTIIKRSRDKINSGGKMRERIKNESLKKEYSLPKDYTLKISEVIRYDDPDFAEYLFMERVKRDYNTITKCMTERNSEPLKEFMGDVLYNRYREQISKMLQTGVYNVRSDIMIDSLYFNLYKRDKNFEYITVFMLGTQKDYYTDINGTLVLNSQDALLDKPVLITYTRRKGVHGTDVPHQISCPNCGASMYPQSSRICPYCRSAISIGDFTWMMTDIRVTDLNSTEYDDRGILIEDDSSVQFTRDDNGTFTGYYDNGVNFDYKDPYKNNMEEAFRNLYESQAEYLKEKEEADKKYKALKRWSKK